MIKELQKRPFMRPLLIWITGILLQTMCDSRLLSLILLVSPFLLLALTFLMPEIRPRFCHYETRWVWGAVFLSLLLFLSVQRTAWCDYIPEAENPSLLNRLAKEEQLRLLQPFDNLCLKDAEKAVLATLTLGYRDTMDRNTRKQFSIAGVAHILAVSGFHVAVVCGLLSFFFSIFPEKEYFRWIKYLLTVGLLWSFVGITGLAASAVRSAIMLTLYLTGRLLRRTTDGYNILAASAFCMLVYDPFYLFDIGFQLSYMAVLSILYFQPRLGRMLEVRNSLLSNPWSWITVTLAAQVGTTFLCLYYFGQFSLVFLFTNLPLTLIATFLIPAGLIWMLFPPVFPGYHLLQSVVEMLTHSLVWIVDAFSRVPGATFHFRFDLLMVLLGYGVILLTILYQQTKRPRLLLSALLLLFFMLVHLLFEKNMLCGT